MTYILGLLIDGTHKERKKSCRWWKCFGWDCIPIFLSLQKALPAVANRKTECPFQTGFGITIGDIWENNRRYFQNIRRFSEKAYTFRSKRLLLFRERSAFPLPKPGSPTSKASIRPSSSPGTSQTNKVSVSKSSYLLSFCTVIPTISNICDAYVQPFGKNLFTLIRNWKVSGCADPQWIRAKGLKTIFVYVRTCILQK